MWIALEIPADHGLDCGKDHIHADRVAVAFTQEMRGDFRCDDSDLSKKWIHRAR